MNHIICGDVTEELRKLPDKSVNLFILDPPYWKVVNEGWDFQWRVIGDYREWCREWLQEVSRVATINASLYIFGFVRNLVYLHEDITKIGFEFRQPITINKGIRSIGGRKTKTYQMFPNVTESLWFFRKDSKPFIKKFLKEKQKASGLKAKDINKALGVKTNGGGVWSLYTGENILAQVPTEDMWERLQKVLGFEYPYSEIAPVFNIEMGVIDVWDEFDFYEKKRIHPTQKPVPLVKRIINASSNTNDVVCDPFFGSGSTGMACKELDRKFIGIEIVPHFCEQAQKRIDGEETMPYSQYKKLIKKEESPTEKEKP